MLRTPMCLIAAATLTIAGYSYPVHAAGNPTTPMPGQPLNNSPTSADRAMPGAMPGSMPMDMPTTRPMVPEAELKNVHKTLAGAVNDSLRTAQYAALGDYITVQNDSANPSTSPPQTPADNPGIPGSNDSKPNRNNLMYPDRHSTGAIMFKNTQDINDAVAQLQKDWQEKYNSNFEISDANCAAVFHDSCQIVQGNLSDAARLASDRMQTSTPEQAHYATDAGSMETSATVILNATADQPGTMLQLVRDTPTATVWKILEPAGTTDQAIHDRLLTQLTQLHDARANWPADQNAAARAVADHVLSAFATPVAAPATPAMPNTPANAH